jgi:hypothetical protein
MGYAQSGLRGRKPCTLILQLSAHRRAKALAQLVEALKPVAPVRDHQLGSGRGSRRTNVSRKVSNREIYLMADSGNDRDWRARYGARHLLIVEGPQIFK